jgi:indole-3-glycerol phosphate synthase
MEVEACLSSGARLLGINNRSLKDFKVDLQVSLDLLKDCPPGLPVVSESGIFTRSDAEALQKAGACAILVGESLMTKPDPGAAARELMADS